MNKMNILIIGSGGREHALAWKIKQSKNAGEIFVAPGNAGTAQIGTNLDILVNEFDKIKNAVSNHQINLVVVGPEDPLVKGISDYFKTDPNLKNILLIGPSKKGAQLEGSKEFAKIFMNKYAIPTARHKSFTSDKIQEAYTFLDELEAPYVLKADGLAAGKGVVILNDLNQAKIELKEMLGGKFGKASQKVVIEEFLDGIEVSVFVLTDGEKYKILPEAKDYKRIGEGDTGPNTGGMGAISPVPFADKEFMQKVEERIIKPTIEGLKNEKIDYCGFIFFGLIKVKNEPIVIEYNVRMGDPETEVVMPRIESDFLELLIACAEKRLDKAEIKIKKETCSTVVLASKGYPGDYEKGKNIEIGNQIEHAIVFHAGTKLLGNKPVTNGGRVLAVSGLGSTMTNALIKSYEMADKINFDGKQFRRDIGLDL
jgi:phosphoribosylamine---glycine ligase